MRSVVKSTKALQEVWCIDGYPSPAYPEQANAVRINFPMTTNAMCYAYTFEIDKVDVIESLIM